MPPSGQSSPKQLRVQDFLPTWQKWWWIRWLTLLRVYYLLGIVLNVTLVYLHLLAGLTSKTTLKVGTTILILQNMETEWETFELPKAPQEVKGRAKMPKSMSLLNMPKHWVNSIDESVQCVYILGGEWKSTMWFSTWEKVLTGSEEVEMSCTGHWADKIHSEVFWCPRQEYRWTRPLFCF